MTSCIVQNWIYCLFLLQFPVFQTGMVRKKVRRKRTNQSNTGLWSLQKRLKECAQKWPRLLQFVFEVSAMSAWCWPFRERTRPSSLQIALQFYLWKQYLRFFFSTLVLQILLQFPTISILIWKTSKTCGLRWKRKHCKHSRNTSITQNF